MSQPPSDMRPVLSAPWSWAVRVLAWTAFGLSAYLAVTTLGHTPVAGCAGGDTVDCDAVLNSRWSMWLGLPVAVGGLACYAALASLSVLLRPRRPSARRWIGPVVLMLSIVAGGAGLWFIGLQLLVIGKICLLCMGVHLCGVTIAALTLWTMVLRPAMAHMRAMIRQPRSPRALDRQVLVLQSTLQSTRPTAASRGGALTSNPAGAVPIGLAFGGALAVLMLLVGGQIFFPPDTFIVRSVALDDTIAMDAADEPAKRDPSATSPTAEPYVVRRPPMGPLAADDPAADVSPADNGESAAAGHAAHEPAAAARSAGAADRSAELFAAEVDERAGDDGAADLFATESDADAQDLFGTASDESSNDLFGTRDGAAEADAPGADAVGLEPVVPVSAAGAPQNAATAARSSVAEEPLGETPAKRERTVTFLGGGLTLDMYKHPVLGSMDAPHVIVELFSYDCPHCRKMHRMIQQGLKRYEGQLAVVELVVPLEIGCNRYITNSKFSHRGSCAISRLSLAVAAADRTVFPAFHDWLMADPKKPPSPEEALAYAYQIVDRDKLRAMAQSEQIKSELDSYVELYAALRSLPGGRQNSFGLPVQILGHEIVSGNVASAEQLYQLWEKNLGLRPPTSAE